MGDWLRDHLQISKGMGDCIGEFIEGKLGKGAALKYKFKNPIKSDFV